MKGDQLSFRNTNVNKKVLLRERKRHTARHVASPWPGGGGYPPILPSSHPDLAREGESLPLSGGGGEGTYLRVAPPLILTWPGGGGYLPWLGVPTLGYPHPDLAGGTYLGVPPTLLTWLGVPTLGYPYPPDLAGGLPTFARGYLPWGTPPGVNRQTPVKIVPSRRTMYVDGNNCAERQTAFLLNCTVKELAGLRNVDKSICCKRRI